MPLVIFRLMQNQLTLFDLDLVPFFKTQYVFAKALYYTFSDDFEFADQSKTDEPKNKYYAPVEELSDEELRTAAISQGIEISAPYIRRKLERALENKCPQKYYKQGIITGTIDNLVETMIIQGPDGIAAPISYGKFNEKYFKDDVKEPFDQIVYLFLNFHPEKRPILWRILIAQVHIHNAIIKAREMRDSGPQKSSSVLEMMTEEEWIKRFNWYFETEKYSKEEVYTKPFAIVKNYLSNKLKNIMEKSSFGEKSRS